MDRDKFKYISRQVCFSAGLWVLLQAIEHVQTKHRHTHQPHTHKDSKIDNQRLIVYNVSGVTT